MGGELVNRCGIVPNDLKQSKDIRKSIKIFITNLPEILLRAYVEVNDAHYILLCIFSNVVKPENGTKDTSQLICSFLEQ